MTADATLPIVDGYELIRPVGVGSLGRVYLAKHQRMNRDVALKILHSHVCERPEIVENYILEARAVAKLSHAHIVQGYDAGEDNGHYFFAMEYLSGGTFSDKLAKDGPIPVKDAMVYLYQVASALAHAWQQKIIHCDLKPANLMLNERGELKVTDLGLAHFQSDTTDVDSASSGRRVVRGTPHYLSPEQIKTPDDLDCRSDLYSLGATFYHLLTGKQPFSGENNKAIILARLKTSPQPIAELRKDLPKELSKLIDQMLEREPEDRPQTAEEVQERLLDAGLDPKEAGDMAAAVRLAQTRSSSKKTQPKGKTRTGITRTGMNAAERGHTDIHAHSGRHQTPVKLYYGIAAGLALLMLFMILYALMTA